MVNLEKNNFNTLIHTIRGKQVILDRDLSKLYEVKTKRLNEQVKRNSRRFPKDFMFQLTTFEYNSLRSQFATFEKGRGIHRKYLPYVFTEQGVVMLSGILKSKKAIEINIQIMRAFIIMRKILKRNAQIFQRIDNVEQKLLKHDSKFEQIFKLIENKEIKPKKGIFFDGQIFDAYKFISD